MRASVFVGVSVDGFIARVDDGLDWLPEDGGEPHGYDEFMASVDALVIGRRTFERLIITRVPVLIGSGIPLFGSLPRDLRLQHLATRTFPSGLVQSEYGVLG